MGHEIYQKKYLNKPKKAKKWGQTTYKWKWSYQKWSKNNNNLYNSNQRNKARRMVYSNEGMNHNWESNEWKGVRKKWKNKKGDFFLMRLFLCGSDAYLAERVTRYNFQTTCFCQHVALQNMFFATCCKNLQQIAT